MSYAPGPSFLGLKAINLTDDTEVSAGGENEQLLQPPKGQVYKITAIDYKASDPVGSGQGDHILFIKYEVSNISTLDNDVFLAQGISETGSDLKILFNEFQAGSSIPGNNTEEKIFFGSRIMVASNSVPLSFRYINHTDVAQTGERKLNIISEVYKDVL
jgi:hypothetical protein